METGEERGCRNPPASSSGPEPKRPVTIDAEAGPEPKKPRQDAEMNVDSVVDAEARESDDEECDWVPEVTDSRTGQILDPKLVETAREEERKARALGGAVATAAAAKRESKRAARREGGGAATGVVVDCIASARSAPAFWVSRSRIARGVGVRSARCPAMF